MKLTDTEICDILKLLQAGCYLQWDKVEEQIDKFWKHE